MLHKLQILFNAAKQGISHDQVLGSKRFLCQKLLVSFVGFKVLWKQNDRNDFLMGQDKGGGTFGFEDGTGYQIHQGKNWYDVL